MESPCRSIVGTFDPSSAARIVVSCGDVGAGSRGAGISDDRRFISINLSLFHVTYKIAMNV